MTRAPTRQGPLRIVAGTAALAIAAFAAWWTWASEPHQAGAHPEPAGHDMAGMAMGDGVVRIEPGLARTLGVTVVAATLAPLRREIRASGEVVYDETRLSTVSARFSGFVERLHVDFTGQAVRRGEPLLDIYSPELLSAQEELLAALRLERQLAGSLAPGVAERGASLLQAARQHLLLWEVTPAQVEELERTGQARRVMEIYAPASGVVVERLVQTGQSVSAGMALYRLADLSTVWVEADVHERDLRFVRTGEPVQVELAAYPGETFFGRVSYVAFEVRSDTRTVRVRVQMPNPDRRAKPGMYATIELDAPVQERAVVVPRDAVMHAGTHAMVFVEEAPGVYRPREVRTGMDDGGFTQILSGLLAGERVVARANFLIDADSRLMDAMGSMPGMNH